jgi:hypothetical protein
MCRQLSKIAFGKPENLTFAIFGNPLNGMPVLQTGIP